ncbi:MAG: enoyl-CoA hydratase/isomerase family protein, partial [Pseudomonadota bacterium]
FTNETRNTFEAAGEDSGQHYIAAVRGACAGGGYELALACNQIYMTDDATTSVALPEVPLLAVLPGTGGLTRVTDKRKVRRDRADVFCSVEEGIKGKRAKDWRLVDEVIANSKFDEFVSDKAKEIGEAAKGGKELKGIELTPINRKIHEDGSLTYSSVEVEVDRNLDTATITIAGPEDKGPASVEALHVQGADCWALRCARELDDAILHLRLNELELGVIIFKTAGDPEHVVAHEDFLFSNREDDWLSNEILHYWKRVLKRIDVTSRSLVALVENGSCFAGILAELLFAVDRSYMMEGDFEEDNRPVAVIKLTSANFGPFPMANDLSRLETRFLGEPEMVDEAKEASGELLEAFDVDRLGLVTECFDDVDWEDEIRIFLEERSSFSPDAMTGMEANLR